jgi:hypothetical protein
VEVAEVTPDPKGTWIVFITIFPLLSKHRASVVVRGRLSTYGARPPATTRGQRSNETASRHKKHKGKKEHIFHRSSSSSVVNKHNYSNSTDSNPIITMDQHQSIPYQELSFEADDFDYASIATSIQEDGAARNSEESQEGFSFAAATNPRKNLTATFDQQIGVAHLERSTIASTATASTTASTSTSTSTSTVGGVWNRIAQFEAASQHAASATSGATSGATSSATSSAISSATGSKPPLPLKQQSNAVPENRLAVYLRIRPSTDNDNNNNSSSSSHTSTPASRSTSTIEVLKAKHPIIHPTTVRTYPPADSNTTKIHAQSHRSDATAHHDLHAKQFDFHQVLTPETTQKTVYSMVATPLLQDLFDATLHPKKKSNSNSNSNDPQSALLFSYGITNAGKTHTILGDLKSKNDAKWGMIPRAIADVFDRKQQQPKGFGSQPQVDLYMSFFEIYNENVYDLCPKQGQHNKSNPMVGAFPEALKVRERQGQTIVRGLAKHKIRDIQHGIELTVAANHRRHTSSNNLNSDSSRSHCVCQMQLVRRPSSNNYAKTTNDEESVVSNSGYSTDEEANRQQQRVASTIWIVDLAGSERSKRTQMGMARQKEASIINKSLMTLMRCLTVMRTNGQSSSSSSNNIVPFRESKLTHVFMGHLAGSSAARTAMIVNVNPSVQDFDETQHVLAYAASVKRIPIDPLELQQKRSLYFGSDSSKNRNDDEYGMDGHKKKKRKATTTTLPTKKAGTTSTTTGVLSKVAKKLSPKKFMKRWGANSEKRKLPTNHSTKGRPLPVVGGLKKCPSSSSLNASNHSQTTKEPAMKRPRAGTMDNKEAAMMQPAPVANPTTTSTSVDRTELRLAQQALKQANLELEQVRNEKEELLEELATQESHIRLEVCQEMEERLRMARERHSREVERLRAQIPEAHNNNPLLLASTRTAQRDDAERHLEELMDKVDECEGEIQRLRQQHEQELTQLKEGHSKEVARLQQAQMAKQNSLVADTKRVESLEAELKASRNQVDRLKKSKLELVENYERLLEEQNNSKKDLSEDEEDENDSNEDDDDEEEEQDEENQEVPLWKQKMTRSKVRKVLGTISGNTATSSTSKDNVLEKGKGGDHEQWVFPKISSSQMGDGLYRRPMGRAPSGRDWDASVGAWKLVN